MPIASTFAAAAARGFGFGQGILIPRVGTGVTNSSGTTSTSLSLPSGSSVGDFCVVYVAFQGFVDDNTVTSAGAGTWTKSALLWTTLGYYSAIFRKTLATGDLAGLTLHQPLSPNPSPVIVAVYPSSVTTLTVKSSTSSAGSTLTLTGFTRAINSKVVLSFISDRDVGGTATVSGPLTVVTSGDNGVFLSVMADCTVVSRYAGSNVVWSSLSAIFEQAGYLVELT